MIQFDENGNLIPYRAIQTTLDEVDEYLVKPFPLSSTRSELFSQLTTCIELLKIEVYAQFDVLLDGSFVTQKQSPNDIDLVIFLEYSVCNKFENELRKFKDQRLFPSLDLYIERVYPINHPYFVRYQSDRAYWQDFFSCNRRGQFKGFLTLSFRDDS